MHVTSYSHGAGTAYTGHDNNNAGFSWGYQSALRWSNGADEIPVVSGRRIEVQVLLGGRVTQPVPAVMDDFGTLVLVDD